MYCVAKMVKSRFYDNHSAMFKYALSIKKNLYKAESLRTKYFCIEFSDNSRLSWRYYDQQLNLMSWYYYI
jgi:hypothetical protein